MKESLILNYPIYEYFRLSNTRRYDIIKYQKAKYLCISEQKYFDIRLQSKILDILYTQECILIE